MEGFNTHQGRYLLKVVVETIPSRIMDMTRGHSNIICKAGLTSRCAGRDSFLFFGLHTTIFAAGLELFNYASSIFFLISSEIGHRPRFFGLTSTKLSSRCLFLAVLNLQLLNVQPSFWKSSKVRPSVLRFCVSTMHAIMLVYIFDNSRETV